MTGLPNPRSLRVVDDDPQRSEEALAGAPTLGRALASIEHDRRPELPADATLQSVPRALGHVSVRDDHRRVASASVTRRRAGGDVEEQLAGRPEVTEILEGVGTTFEVLGPIARPHTEPTSEPAAVRERGETILCVDDEAAVLRAIGRALRRLGYTVLTADNAAEALQTCDDARAPIDLVITDLTMPGITGLALACELKARHPDMAVILSSGVTVPPDQSQIDALLPKPYTIAELSEVVVAVLGRPAPCDRPDRLRIATPPA